MSKRGPKAVKMNPSTRSVCRLMCCLWVYCLTPSLKKANYILDSKSKMVLDSEPKAFSSKGYILIIVGLGLFVAVGGVASYCEHGIGGANCHSAKVSPLYYIGQSTMLVGSFL